MKKRSKKDQAKRLKAIEEKWTPRGEAAGEWTHENVVATAQHTQALVHTGMVLGKAYVSKLRG